MTTPYGSGTCSTMPERGVQLASGRSRTDLDSDELFGLGMTRLVEIIGEAAARVGATTRKRYPQIPWSSIAGMRNRLIHGYDVVDFWSGYDDRCQSLEVN